MRWAGVRAGLFVFFRQVCRSWESITASCCLRSLSSFRNMSFCQDHAPEIHGVIQFMVQSFSGEPLKTRFCPEPSRILICYSVLVSVSFVRSQFFSGSGHVCAVCSRRRLNSAVPWSYWHGCSFCLRKPIHTYPFARRVNESSSARNSPNAHQTI